jgi:molecular chaperone DnaK
VARTTVDFGIDLGTTNSAIAMMSEGRPLVLRNNDQQELTPSAVMIDRDGTVTVGARAAQRAELRPEMVAREFKRAMGSDRIYTVSNHRLTPEELSAEVLRSLRADAQLRTGESIEAAVVTIPAMFSHAAADATVRASRLAGFDQVAFLQEPIAAGLAYGLTSAGSDGYWLVYDLGGGTFDVSLMNLKSGRLRVVDHSGDEFLGGRDFDNLLVDFLVDHLRSDFRLPALVRGDDRYGRLKLACEQAKKALTGQVSTVVDVAGFKDDDGKPIDTEVTVKRADYEVLIQPLVMKTIKIILGTLRREDLPPSAISRVLLVGGPTLTPLVRQLLASETGITLDPRIDPMTVVAQGAAMFSSTVAIEKPRPSTVAPGVVGLDLKYDAVSDDTQSLVAGRISQASSNMSGLTVELVRDDGGWSSGRAPIANGRFVVTLVLRLRQVNGFAVRIYDSTGRILPASPDTLTITQGVVAPDPILSRSFGVAVESEEDAPRTVRLLSKGDRLPATNRVIFRTTRSLAPADPGGINIHVVEGEAELAESNGHAGFIRIDGTSIARALPVGSEVELRFDIDTSRRMLVKAFVPLLDDTFLLEIRDVNDPVPNVTVLRRQLETQRERLRGVTDHASVGEAPALLSEAESALVAAEAHDEDSARKAQQRLQELRAQLDRSYDRARLPMLRAEFEELLPQVRQVLAEFGDASTQRQAETNAKDIARALDEGDVATVKLRMDQLQQLHFGTLLEQPGWWVGLYQDLVEKLSQFEDQNLAKVLIMDGRKALDRQDFGALRQVCSRLWSLLPSSGRAGMSRTLPDVGIRL